MSEITRILIEFEKGDPAAADKLLPLVYEELRQLAASRLAVEKPGQTLQATSLVHEAYLRLLGNGADFPWASKAQFFAAAAEAMRRILVESARRKKSLKRGGDLQRIDLLAGEAMEQVGDEDRLLDLDLALRKLEVSEPALSKLVQLRYFAGLSVEETAQALGISQRTVKRNWTYARAWLLRALE